MVDERIVVSVTDKIAPSIAINFHKIAKEAGTAAAAVEALSKSIGKLNALSFAGIASSLRGAGSAIASHVSMIDSLIQRQRAMDELLGRSRSVGGDGNLFGDGIRQSTAQLTLLNSLLSTTAINTAKVTAEATAMAAAFGAAAAASAKISPRLPSGSTGTTSGQDRAAIDAARATDNYNRSNRDMIYLISGSGGAFAALSLLTRGFGLVGAAAAAATVAVAKLSDTYIIVNAQVSNSTKTALEAAMAVGELRKIAADTGAPLSDLSRSFGRFNRALAENNVPMSKTLEMTNTITNALKMNGATTQEASSAMLQFSQALGKGYMNGDEFRNMMETMPMVAQQVANTMGVSFGQLKDAASQGKVTWDVLLEAITDPEFQAEMKRKADAVNLFQYSWQAFSDKLVYAIGQFDSFIGASSGVKSALDSMGDSIAAVGNSFESMRNTIEAAKVSSELFANGLIAKFPMLQDAFNSFSSNSFVSEISRIIDVASNPYLMNFLKLIGAAVSAPTKIGDAYVTRKTAMQTLMPGYGMTGEQLSSGSVTFGRSKLDEVSRERVVRDKRLADLVKRWQSYDITEAEYLEEFNRLVYGEGDKKAGGGSSGVGRLKSGIDENKRYIETLREEVATLGLSSEALKYYEIAKKAASMPEYANEIYAHANAMHAHSAAIAADEEALRQREAAIKRNNDLINQGIAYGEEMKAKALAAYDVKKSLMTDEQRILIEATNRWDEYTRMVSEGFLTQEEATRAYVNEFDENAKMLKTIGMSIRDSFAEFLFDPFDKGLDGMVDGFANMLKKIAAEKAASKLFNMAGEWGRSVSGSGGLLGTIGSIVSEMFGGIRSFDGGGYTGNSPRTGGLDGKGGFLAMMHPRENVTDNTKGQKSGGGDTYVTEVNYYATSGENLGSRQTQLQVASKLFQMQQSARRNM